MEVLDALWSEADGKGKLAVLRLWELETINKLGWGEQDWINLPLSERYHKVVANKLSDWMQALETREEIKRLKAESNAR